jgi:hypothetical protein
VSLDRRLEALEERAMPRQRVPEAKPSEARRRMVEHLDQLAALKRGELDPEEAARVETTSAAIQSRLAARRGEGGR